MWLTVYETLQNQLDDVLRRGIERRNKVEKTKKTARKIVKEAVEEAKKPTKQEEAETKPRQQKLLKKWKRRIAGDSERYRRRNLAKNYLARKK